MLSIEIKGLGLHQQNRWLFRGLDLEVPLGKFVGVGGPSGVGKSSFLALLAGMRAPSEGTILFHDNASKQTLTPLAYRSQIGIIFQNFLLTKNASALNNVLCGQLHAFPFWKTLFGFPRPFKEEAFEIMCALGIDPYCHKPVGCISGGEQQRVAIARALFQKPQIYLADEPVSQLDFDLRADVLDLLKAESNEKGKTVLCVLHDPKCLEDYSDVTIRFERNESGPCHVEVSA